jgi:DNA polymerase type B, organellar and viral
MPVLPEKISTKTGAIKLVFHLCHECAKMKITDDQEPFAPTKCTHTDEERAKQGFYPSPEINLALEKGAKILRIFEVHECIETQDLFKPYVRRWYRRKVIGGGLADFEKWQRTGKLPKVFDKEKYGMSEFAIITDKKIMTKERYCAELKDRYDIDIRPDEIGPKNEIFRTTAKLCLNSLWGKYSQKPKYQEIVRCFNKPECDRLIERCFANEFDDFNLEAYDHALIGKVTHFAYQTEENMHINPYIAMSTTSNARIRLYRLSEKCGFKNVIYEDTDSCFYTGNRIEYGVFLGDCADELDGGCMKDKIMSRGPKDYYLSYEDSEGKLHHKFTSKGLMHTKETINTVINYMPDMILESLGVKEKEQRAVQQTRFGKELRGAVYTETISKKIKCEFDKRIPGDPIYNSNGELLMIDTLPYGY